MSCMFAVETDVCFSKTGSLKHVNASENEKPNAAWVCTEVVTKATFYLECHFKCCAGVCHEVIH